MPNQCSERGDGRQYVPITEGHGVLRLSFHYLRKPHRQISFENIEKEHAYGGKFTGCAKNIGGAGRTAPDGAKIDSFERFHKPISAWYRAQQIAEKNHSDCGEHL